MKKDCSFTAWIAVRGLHGLELDFVPLTGRVSDSYDKNCPSLDDLRRDARVNEPFGDLPFAGRSAHSLNVADCPHPVDLGLGRVPERP
jgi:hypothetical protein